MPDGKTKRNNYPPRDGAAMSFEEIGDRLGITKAAAWMLYKNAMRKLRRQCRTGDLQKLRDIAQVLDQERAA